jgi:hypothetical protein
MSERRSQVRVRDSELVMLGWDEDDVEMKQLANVEDVSPNGMGLMISNPLVVGTTVTITYGDEDLVGIIRHQSRRVEGYLVGVEFDASSRNSALHFDPDLLIA